MDSSYKTIELIKASGRSYCRGEERNCIAKYPKKIPEGSKALRISIYGAGGAAVAFYCQACMGSLVENMQKVLEELGV